MNKDLVSENSIEINASVENVWDALVNPQMIKKYLLGAEVVSDWKEGSSITFHGEYQGKTYNDKGVILKIEPNKILEYTHWSDLSGLPDVPENYHKVTCTLTKKNDHVILTLAQDKNKTEKEKEHSDQTWISVLSTIKKLVEEELVEASK